MGGRSIRAGVDVSRRETFFARPGSVKDDRISYWSGFLHISWWIGVAKLFRGTVLVRDCRRRGRVDPPCGLAVRFELRDRAPVDQGMRERRTIADRDLGHRQATGLQGTPRRGAFSGKPFDGRNSFVRV